MGTTAHLVVVGGRPALPAEARARLEDLEARWTRFSPASELRRMNDRAGRPVVVSPETCDLVALAVDAWYRTGGRFDPTVLPALEAAGYDRSFELVDPEAGPVPPGPGPAPGCGQVVLWPASSAVLVPAGVALDLGGIAKGRAADVVAGELLAAGAAGACVNLGGDVRVAGRPPTSDGWVVAVDHPFEEGREIARLALGSGAVVTTTSARRRWHRGGRVLHHLIDPATGEPADAGLAAVTVVAADAVTAEVVAKAAFVSGAGAATELLGALGLSGLLVDADGRVRPVAGLEAFSV